jgi:hypothetical protein
MSAPTTSTNASPAPQTPPTKTDSCLGLIAALLLDNTKVGDDLASMAKGKDEDLALLKQWLDRYHAILQAGKFQELEF